MPQMLNLLEAVDRRVRTTSTGMEIRTTFYVEPATAAPLVVCTLLGRVKGEDLATYSRELPAADHAYPFCYCVEAHETPFDRKSVTSSPTMLGGKFPLGDTTIDMIQNALRKPIIFNGPQSLNPDGTYNKNAPEEVKELCGAYIEAVYRPLPTIYSGASDDSPERKFDYVDPQFYPASRTLQGPPGYLYARYVKTYNPIAPFNYPVPDGANLAVETWQEFTIRRVMCPNVPWKTIQEMTNRVNSGEAWQPKGMTIPGLPNNTFPIGTLRFDSAEPIKRTVPACVEPFLKILPLEQVDDVPVTRISSWYDILYKFSWRTVWDRPIFPNLAWTGPAFPGNAFLIKDPTWITWNQVFTGPFGKVAYYTPVGWYEVAYDDRATLFSDGGRPRYLAAEDPTLSTNQGGFPGMHPFDVLFLMNAP